MAIDFDPDYRMTINGTTIEASETFETYNPATEDVIAMVPDTTRVQLDAVVVAA